MSDQTRTALGSAHGRFVSGLPERGRELRELCVALGAVPHDARQLEQLRRRLQALYAAAQVFQEQTLLDTIKATIAGLDAARDGRRALERGELEAVLALCRKLGAAEQASSEGERPPALSRSGSWSTGALAPGASDGAGPPDTPVAIAQSVAGTLPSPEVIAVLVLSGAEVEREVRAALPLEQCELTSTSEPETALAVIDHVAPDIVLVETNLLARGGEKLVRGLRGDRADGVRAVIALVPERQSDAEALFARAHVDAALRLPLARAGLVERLLRLSGRGPRAASGLGALQAGTVDEIARGVAEEVRRGIADSLRAGRSERIELHDKSELLAAAWSAVARIRTHLATEAAGRIRFDEAPYAGGPAALALTDDAPAARHPDAAANLQGRRILVVDDDPAVVWFFAGLLREAGAVAIEANDGKRALEVARRKPPDLLISDILMPEIDGFTLCRELKRDLVLCHVPVILLSWKEDFLQRMRELDAGASGYLRKEAGSLQILTTVAEALRPRAELVALLAAGGEVQGRTDVLGVPSLLQAVAAARPDARITLRDAWNLFEVDVRGGIALAVTRTASDGSFARGPVALRQLLGVDVGRFTVVHAEGPVRGAFLEPLDKLLADGMHHLCAVLDAVSSGRLMRVERIGFDDEILGALLTATPTALASSAARLRAGESVQELVRSGAHAPGELEQQLRELARRGAVISVSDAHGDDLIAEAARARQDQPGELMHGGQRSSRPSLSSIQLADADVEWVRPRREVVMPDVPPPAVPVAPRAVFRAPPPPRVAPPPVEHARASDAAAAPVPAATRPAGPFNVQSTLLHGPIESARPRVASGAPAGVASEAGRLSLLVTLTLLVAAGYWGWRLLAPRAPSVSPAASARSVPAGPALESPQARPATEGEAGARASFATRTLPFVDRSRGVEVGAGEGLLVVEYDAGGAPPRVSVGDRQLGLAPTATALPGGRHELSLERNGHKSIRFLAIRPGQTQIVDARE